MASALLNAARNTGGSIGVSLASNVLAHREQFHLSRLSEQTIPSSVQYQQTMHQVTDYFVPREATRRRQKPRPSPGSASRRRTRPRCSPTSTCSGR